MQLLARVAADTHVPLAHSRSSGVEQPTRHAAPRTACSATTTLEDAEHQYMLLTDAGSIV
jgi:hypothetical protein